MNDTDLTTAVLRLTEQVATANTTISAVKTQVESMKTDNAAEHQAVVSSVKELTATVGELRTDNAVTQETSKAASATATLALDLAQKAFFAVSAYAAAVTGLRLFG